MPELPDILAYEQALRVRIAGRRLQAVSLTSPFLLRTVDPPLDAFIARTVFDVSHLGKRVVIEFDDELFLVLHLMIAGRLHWRVPGKGRIARGLARFEFDSGVLMLSEAGSTRRASLRAVRGRAALQALDPGGVDVLATDASAFATALTRETHTLKRALTDPRLFAGIGNAYSDEILHAAKLSPFKLSTQLTDEEQARLREACLTVLRAWIAKLQADSATTFPEHVTAFRPDMAVHGKYGQPCPICATPVQRIVYAANESNYCPVCQTAGRLLADRSLSRLLRADWPRTLEELEERKQAGREPAADRKRLPSS